MYVFCSLTDRPKNQVSHILDAKTYRESSQKNKTYIFNTSRVNYIFTIPTYDYFTS